MKKVLLYTALILFVSQNVFADTVFESNDKPVEVKLQPAVSQVQKQETQQKQVQTIKEQKFNTALVNLDDAQVELRQELAVTTSKYNEAVNEKNRMVQNCKCLKREINSIKKKMKNVDKSKKMINQNLQQAN